ncbi:MAG: hypothetical protein K8F60_03805 [Melioribacteraceae bacterium]|nr:hypothetical protein [Melioribacteraceae bacterium]
MNELISNIFNAPQEYEIGQVWYQGDIKEEILITDAANKHLGVIRGMVISPITELADGVDVILEASKNNFLNRNRIVLRFTEGPIKTDYLDFYNGKIESETMDQILLTRMNKEQYYNEEQLHTFERLHSKIEPLFINSLPIEESESETIFADKSYNYSMAASDNYSILNDLEFYNEERKVKDSSIIIYSEGSTTVRISKVNLFYHLVIYSKEIQRVHNISFLDLNGINIIKDTNEIALAENNKGHLYLGRLIKNQSYNLTMILDSLEVSKEVIINE